jgi:hypothetical protein
LLSGKSNVGHTHVKADITDFAHTHDDRYYTETELDSGQLDNRYYTETELNNGQLDNRYYTESELDTKFDAINVDATTTHTQIESIKTVPVGTVDSTVDNFEANGLTLVNSVVNGDFSDGTTGWTNTTFSTNAVSNNILSNTADGNNPDARFLSDEFLVENVQWYIYFKVRTTNADTLKFRFYPLSTSAIFEINNPIQNQWYEYSTITTAANNQYKFLQLRHYYADAATANGKVMQVDGNAGVFAINMTALGIASYTEAQMLDLVRSGYFDGIANVEKPSVTAVGKNLFDGKLESGVYGTSFGLKSANSSYIRNVDFIKVSPNTTYTASRTITGEFVMLYYDNNKNYLVSSNSTSATSLTFTTPLNSHYVAFYMLSTNLNLPVQLELGSTATTYEPYKSSTLTIDTELRSLPNGVRDRVYEQNGEVWLEKRVEEYVFTGLENFSSTAGVAVTNTFLPTSVFEGIVDITTSVSVVNLQYNTETFRNIKVDNFDSAGNEYTSFMFNFTPDRIYFQFPLGTTLQQIKDYMTDKKIQYQLATPQLINLTQEGKVDGELAVYENGTVYNTSDTFHADLSFDVASNRSAQISGLLDSSVYQAKLIDSKASKVQEAWIEPTLLNGWVIYSNDYIPRYYKDEFSVVHLSGLIQSGTTTAGTILFNLPVGYRPTKNIIMPVILASGIGQIIVTTSGVVSLGATGNATYTGLNGVSFRTED